MQSDLKWSFMSTVRKYLLTPPFGVKLLLYDQAYDLGQTVKKYLGKNLFNLIFI